MMDEPEPMKADTEEARAFLDLVEKVVNVPKEEIAEKSSESNPPEDSSV